MEKFLMGNDIADLKIGLILVPVTIYRIKKEKKYD